MTLDFWIQLIEEQHTAILTLWLSVLIFVMYIVRQPMHQLFSLILQSVKSFLRLIARSVTSAEKRLVQRNRSVLLMQGRICSERAIEREFQQVEKLIHRDLSGYPQLQRELKQQITRIDDDYVHSHEVPPLPPEWLKAVEAVADIPDNGSPAVAQILKDIHTTLKKEMGREAGEYHRANRERLNLLKKMKPYWRSLTQTLHSVEKKIIGLEQRSIIIDNQMRTYESIRKSTDDAELMLSESSITQFFISGLALGLALFGLSINYYLIILPMEEMVGASSYLGSSFIRASEASALFIVGMQVMLGVFIMEAAGVTRLLPAIHLLEPHKRKTFFWILIFFLFLFAGIEASLAYMNDILETDRVALTLLLTGIEVVEPPLRWIPSIGQALMAFILPFILVFTSIPLASFLTSIRSVAGVATVWFLQIIVLFIQLMMNIVTSVEHLFIRIYDVIIFIPLAIEEKICAMMRVHQVKKELHENKNQSQQRAQPVKKSNKNKPGIVVDMPLKQKHYLKGL